MIRVPVRYRILSTPTGRFALSEDGCGSLSTTWLDLTDDCHRLPDDATQDERLLPELAARLERYFVGEVVDFGDVPTPTGSPFVRRCWEACRSIPRGETRSYGELATMAGGRGNAARAAGQAMRRNRLPIIIPCHRVISAAGGLHGFSGSSDQGGPALAVKRALLQMEGALKITEPDLAGAKCEHVSLDDPSAYSAAIPSLL
ncbi:MAG: methylated-DNA--[protein]-cysteine S-methyltransferase [Phycisphaerales bacterium]